MITRRYVGKREGKINTEYEKLLSLLCLVNEFPKTKTLQQTIIMK